MAARVPFRRGEPDESVVRAALAPSSQSWMDFALLGNWIRGKGACLVPAVALDLTITSGTTRVFRFRCKTRSSAVQHVVVLWVRANSASGATVTVRSPTGTGTAATYSIPNDRNLATPIVYVRNLSGAGGSEEEVSVSLLANVGTIAVESLAIYEQDNPLLTKNSTHYGADVETMLVRQPIRYVANESYRGVLQSIANSDWRRVGLYHLSVPEAVPLTRTSTSYQAMLSLAVPILPRRVDIGETTGSVKWSVYGFVAGGAGGNVRVTRGSDSATDVMTITATGSPAWTTARSFSFNCEDPENTAVDEEGLPAASTWETLNLEFQGDGANQLSVISVSFWDDDDV